jgi:hypothetical protein
MQFLDLPAAASPARAQVTHHLRIGIQLDLVPEVPVLQRDELDSICL